jgi:amidohydrolase
MFDIIKEVKAIEQEIINWRRDLHQIPEIGLELPKTAKYVSEKLEEMGIQYHTLVDGNAIVGLIKGSGEGNTVGLRADMDGLPIKEETGLSFASTNNNMHACGHDAHTAILLGAAKVLNNNRDKFKGNVKLLFQPAEESPGGAKPMIQEGVLENPKVDAIMGLHVGKISEDIPKGNIGVCYGNLMAAADIVNIKVKGKGAHGAYPELSVDPIVIAAELIMSLQTIISRETKSTDPAVLSICKIQGGTNHNIIPDYVELKGTVRTLNNETRNRIAKRIEEITKSITDAHGATYEYDYEFKYPPVINDSNFTAEFVESAKKILPEDEITEIKVPIMGGEDMSYFLEKVPGTFFFLTNLKKVDGEYYGHHNSKFDVDEQLFWKGSSLLVQAAIDYLNK